jgi:hypothetical protein
MVKRKGRSTRRGATAGYDSANNEPNRALFDMYQMQMRNSHALHGEDLGSNDSEGVGVHEMRTQS